MLKTSPKFGVDPQSFCENHNSVQDQDHDITFHVRTARQPDRQTEFFLLVLSSKIYKT